MGYTGEKNSEPRSFDTVDNTGGWPSYTYRPKFRNTKAKSGKENNYQYHYLPTGTTLVPINKASKNREIKGW